MDKVKDEKSNAGRKAEQEYPGIAVNNTDGHKSNDALAKESTRVLNNNPRNDR